MANDYSTVFHQHIPCLIKRETSYNGKIRLCSKTTCVGICQWQDPASMSCSFLICKVKVTHPSLGRMQWSYKIKYAKCQAAYLTYDRFSINTNYPYIWSQKHWFAANFFKKKKKSTLTLTVLQWCKELAAFFIFIALPGSIKQQHTLTFNFDR